MKTQRQRRKQHRTDYLKRLKMLKSGKPRLVFRLTNRYIIVQYVESFEAKDKIIFGVNSKDLLKHGWSASATGSLNSITASYLTGYLVGKEINSRKLKQPIVDFGMLRMIYGGKQYSFLKGLIEAGLKVECPEKAFPSENRIKGEHMKNKIDFEEIKLKIDKVGGGK